MDEEMKTISSKDFDKLCRGCLRAVVLTERIARVAEMIEYCTNEKVSDEPNTQLPAAMCDECFDRLNSSYQFKKQWTQSHKQLLAILCASPATASKTAISSKRKSEKAAQCFDCGKVFRHPGYLKTHMRSHLDERPHVCHICDMRFVQASNLASHIRIHNGVRPYQCEICSKQFSSSSNLKAHHRTHSQQRDFACHECPLSFKSAAELSNHFGTHSGVRNYRCDLCDKAFYKVAYLNVHRRTVHEKVKRHRCNDCGKQFANTSNLICHQRIHSGAKPFACDACGARFNHSSALTRHTKQHCRMNAERADEVSSRNSTPDMEPLDVDASPVGSMGSNVALNVDDDDDDDNDCLAASILATSLANNGCDGQLTVDHESSVYDAMTHPFSDSEYCRFDAFNFNNRN